jgi:Ca2+-binding RTX toxin-like protein
VITGDTGNNVLIGLDSVDILNGGDGNDTIEGGRGGDILSGGNGIDTLSYENSMSTVRINMAPAGNGNITLASSGDATGDTVTDDFENLVGSVRIDFLSGNNGNNVIVGGGGADVMDGSGGNDTYRFRSLSEIQEDLIVFGSGDKIDLQAIDAITGGSDDTFTFVSGPLTAAGQLHFVGGFVEGDVNGGGADFRINVTGAASLSASDFIL